MPGGGRSHVGAGRMLFLDLCPVLQEVSTSFDRNL